MNPALQKNMLHRNFFDDLRSPGLFAKRPTVGILMFVFGTLVFGAIAYAVSTKPAVTQWDIDIARRIHAVALTIPSALVEYLVFGFFVGREIIVLLAGGLAIYFLRKRYWREFAMILLGPGVGGLLWYVLCRFFDRPRPTIQMNIALTDPSFPSGHALSAVVFYGLLAYLLVPRMPSRFWKWFVSILCAFVAIFIGVSRVMLGGHYVTDVVAGYALGIAWAGLVYTLMEIFFKESAVQNMGSSRATSLEGLQSPGLFRKWPMLGILLILLGSLSFGALGYNLVTKGPLVQLDAVVYKDMLAQWADAPPRISELMLFGFFVGKQIILVMVTLLSIYFFYKRYWRELAMILISSAGGSFVWNYFVSYFARPRPPEQIGLEVTSIPSFPSGHAMSAIIVYGFLAYLLIPHMPSRFWKWMVGFVAVIVILFDGYSRVFQGGHYLTDVLAGYALGLAWAVLVYTLIEFVFMKRKVSTNG